MAIDTTDDELDGLVRAAMKTLDAQVPSGYFEGLPNRTLARLEDSSMQTTSSSGKTELPVELSATQTPKSGPVKEERDEDSGLHDIRNLASSQRSRLSSRRLGTNPPPVDDDLLASTSGSWKSIALPEPAKMVSLPEISSSSISSSSLLSKADIKAQEKADKAAAKIARKSRPSGEMQAPPLVASAGGAEIAPSTSAPAMPAVATIDVPVALDEAVAKPATEAPVFGARISGMKTAKPVTPIGDAPKKKRGALIAAIGTVVAAAAGVVIYVAIDKKNAEHVAAPASDGMVERQRAEAAMAKPTPTAQAIATDTKAEAKPDDAVAGSGSAAAPADPAPVEPPPVVPTKAQPTTKGKKPAPPKGKQVIEVPDPGNGVGKKPDKVEKPTPKKEPGKDGDPDFDQLIKDSGYQKKVDKPKLDKKELNAADFRKGIGGVQGKAMGCYNGTQGTAMVKIFIAPSGSVTNVVVSGAFANTPVAACIVGAVKSASFPAWDGPPASYNYSYLLAN